MVAGVGLVATFRTLQHHKSGVSTYTSYLDSAPQTELSIRSQNSKCLHNQHALHNQRLATALGHICVVGLATTAGFADS